MWRAEGAAGDVALMRVPLTMLTDGSDSVSASDYLTLPRVEGYDFQNRFVGDYLLYGSGSGWGYPKSAPHSPLFLVRWTDGENYQLALDHGTDRIEQMGRTPLWSGRMKGSAFHFRGSHGLSQSRRCLRAKGCISGRACAARVSFTSRMAKTLERLACR